ncbi:hypothetical protein GCM10027347_59560 [Larkinella harenae]
MTETLTELCKRLEHFETPEWAAEAILRKEILTQCVVDPCCGTGILSDVAMRSGYTINAIDINHWGYPFTNVKDFLQYDKRLDGCTVFMNPPFSKAVQFVEQAFDLGARKIVCFQRFAWYESKARREFWEKYPPNRIYICSDRADCWRHDIPQAQRTSSSPTAHAWFVWERGQPSGTLLGHISKAGV